MNNTAVNNTIDDYCSLYCSVCEEYYSPQGNSIILCKVTNENNTFNFLLYIIIILTVLALFILGFTFIKKKSQNKVISMKQGVKINRENHCNKCDSSNKNLHQENLVVKENNGGDNHMIEFHNGLVLKENELFGKALDKNIELYKDMKDQSYDSLMIKPNIEAENGSGFGSIKFKSPMRKTKDLVASARSSFNGNYIINSPEYKSKGICNSIIKSQIEENFSLNEDQSQKDSIKHIYSSPEKVSKKEGFMTSPRKKYSTNMYFEEIKEDEEEEKEAVSNEGQEEIGKIEKNSISKISRKEIKRNRRRLLRKK